MTTTFNKPQLGDEVKCLITGFTGIVTSTAQCLTGCDRVGIQPPLGKDGKFTDSMWFDETAVEILTKGKVKPQSVQAPDNTSSKPKRGGPPSRGMP